MSGPLDGYRLCKVDEESHYVNTYSESFKRINDAKSCAHPLLASADMFTHRDISRSMYYQVSCGRSGCAAGGLARTRAEAESRCVSIIEEKAKERKTPPPETLWLAIAEGVKRYGLSPRYAWHKEYERGCA